jgi:hypothetical protein
MRTYLFSAMKYTVAIVLTALLSMVAIAEPRRVHVTPDPTLAWQLVSFSDAYDASEYAARWRLNIGAGNVLQVVTTNDAGRAYYLVFYRAACEPCLIDDTRERFRMSEHTTIEEASTQYHERSAPRGVISTPNGTHLTYWYEGVTRP